MQPYYCDIDLHARILYVCITLTTWIDLCSLR